MFRYRVDPPHPERGRTPRSKGEGDVMKFIALVAAVLLSTLSASAANETPWDLLTAFPAYITMQTYHAPSVASVMGKTHLFYEIYVLNAYGADVDVAALRVTANGTPAAAFRGPELAAMMRPLGSPQTKPSRTIAAGQTVVFYVDVPFPAAHDVPAQLQDELTISVPQVGGKTFAVKQSFISINPNSPIPIQPPLRGTGWFAGDAPANDTGHRRTIFFRDGRPYLGQRFAIDWVQGMIDAKGHVSFFHGDAKKNENWYCWNAPLFAVADGVVAGVRSDLPENVPLEPPVVRLSQHTLGGNYLIVNIGFGRYAFYAHLRPHSTTLKVGDRVRQGQIIGRLGNSGNSSAPHLHFHITDAPEFIFADGEPYTFARIKVATSTFDEAKFEDGAQLSSPFENYSNTMPGNGAVVDFGSTYVTPER